LECWQNLLDYVIRRLNALSAGLKNRLGGLTFAEAPPNAISRFSWSPESTEVRPLLKAPREDDSSFRVDLEQATPNKKPFMKFVSVTKPIAVSHQIHTYTELLQQIHHDPPLRTRDVISQRPPFHFSRVKQLAVIIAALTFLFVGLWFGVSMYHAPRPSYPYYDTQKPVPPWSEPTPLEGNRDRGGEYR